MRRFSLALAWPKSARIGSYGPRQGRRPPRTEVGKGALQVWSPLVFRFNSLLGALGPVFGCSWSLLASLGRLLASLCVSVAFRERFGVILEPFLEPKSMIVEAFFRTSRDLFLDLLFSQFFVRRCSEICYLCTWRKKATQANSSRKPMVFHDFSKFACPPGSPRGRHERIKKITNTKKYLKQLDV